MVAVLLEQHCVQTCFVVIGIAGKVRFSHEHLTKQRKLFETIFFKKQQKNNADKNLASPHSEGEIFF